MLPGMLNVYSSHLKRFTKIARNTVKRLTMAHVSALRVIHYVEYRTGSPRYADMAELLEQGCLIAGKQENVPRFITAEGLAKLYQRWGKAVRPPESK
jgi:broad specificity phosphatase PhoE